MNRAPFEYKEYKVYLLIIILVAGCYLFTLNYSFITFDDRGLIVNNENIRSLSIENIKSIFTLRGTGTYQPIRELSYALNYAISGLATWNYRLTNIILYILSLLVLFRILLHLFGDPKIPLLSTLVFAVHPIHVESVTWLSARKEVLMLLFSLLSLLFFVKYTDKRRFWHILLTFTLFLLAILSKPTAVILPVVYLVYYVFFGMDLQKKLYLVTPFLVVSFLLFFYFIFYSGVAPESAELYPGISVWKIFYNLGHYTRTLLIPINLSARYMQISDPGLMDWIAITGILTVILSITGFFYWRKSKVLRFFILFYYINLLPSIGLVKVAIPRADRYVLLSSISFSLLIGWIMSLIMDKVKFKWKFAIPVVIILLYCCLTVYQNTMWRDEMTLYGRSFDNSPSYGFGRAYAARLMTHEKYQEAIAVLNEAAEENKMDYRLAHDLGNAYRKMDNVELASQYLHDALINCPNLEDSIEIIKDNVLLNLEMENYHEAVNELYFLYLKTEDSRYLHDYAVYNFKIGQVNLAINTLERMWEYGQGSPMVLRNLCYFLYKGGFSEAARSRCKEFINLYPDNKNAPKIKEILKELGD